MSTRIWLRTLAANAVRVFLLTIASAACAERNISIDQIDPGIIWSQPSGLTGLIAVVEPVGTTVVSDMLCRVFARDSCLSCFDRVAVNPSASSEAPTERGLPELLRTARDLEFGSAAVVRIEGDSFAGGGSQRMFNGYQVLQGRLRLWDVETSRLLARGRIRVVADAACLVALDDPELRIRAHKAAAVTLSEEAAKALVPHTHAEDVTVFVEWTIPDSRKALRAVSAGDWKLAVEIARKGVEDSSWAGWANAQVRAQAWHNLGVALAGRGHFVEADAALAQAQAFADLPATARERLRVRTLLDVQRALTLDDVTVTVDLCKVQPDWATRP